MAGIFTSWHKLSHTVPGIPDHSPRDPGPQSPGLWASSGLSEPTDLSIFSVQSCNKIRTEVFYELLNKQKKLKAQYNFLQKESKAQLEACSTELVKEKTEVARLKKELDRVNTRNSELTSSLGIEHAARQKDAQEFADKLAELVSRGTTAKKELSALQAKCDTWLAELVVITNEMGRKCSFALLFTSSFPTFLLPLSITLHVAAFLCSEFYETTATKAFREAEKARAQRATAIGRAHV